MDSKLSAGKLKTVPGLSDQHCHATGRATAIKVKAPLENKVVNQSLCLRSNGFALKRGKRNKNQFFKLKSTID